MQILNDDAFVSSYLSACTLQLAKSHRFITSLLQQNGINYLKGGYASPECEDRTPPMVPVLAMLILLR